MVWLWRVTFIYAASWLFILIQSIFILKLDNPSRNTLLVKIQISPTVSVEVEGFWNDHAVAQGPLKVLHLLHLSLKKVLPLKHCEELLLKKMLQPKPDKELLLLHCLLPFFFQSQSLEGGGGAVSHNPSFLFPMSLHLHKLHDESGDHPFGLEEIRRRVHWKKKKVWGKTFHMKAVIKEMQQGVKLKPVSSDVTESNPEFCQDVGTVSTGTDTGFYEDLLKNRRKETLPFLQ